MMLPIDVPPELAPMFAAAEQRGRIDGYSRLIAAMVCFVAFFGVALGLGTWLPNMMADRGMTITKSLTYTFGMTLAFPCASLFMMFALERFGRKKTSITAFAMAGLFAVAFVNAGTDTMLLVVGFCMIFFIQLSGNSMQIFASEVFPTNARASGFGIAQGGSVPPSPCRPFCGCSTAWASGRCLPASRRCW